MRPRSRPTAFQFQTNEKETHTHKEWRLAKERPKCRREGGDAAYTLTIRPGNEGRQEVSDLFFTRVLTRLLRGGGGRVNPGTEDRPATAPCDRITDWRERGGKRTERKGLGKANSWGGGIRVSWMMGMKGMYSGWGGEGGVWGASGSAGSSG